MIFKMLLIFKYLNAIFQYSNVVLEYLCSILFVFSIILAFSGGKTAVGLSDFMKHKEYTFDEIVLFYINVGMSR